MKRFCFLICIVFCASAFAFDHSHSVWDGLLKKNVMVLAGGKASQLRYAAMAQERGALDRYLQEISSVTESEFSRWTREQQMAFLVNAYNAFMVEKVLSRYPDIKSIWDFGKLFGNPFKDRFFVLLNKSFSLDEIEHEILRKRYRDPRVHYALNCASVGCPMLREEAYVGERLEAQLDEQARRFLSDRSRNRIREGRLEVSRIFDWFQEDFAPLQEYFARHAPLLTRDPVLERQIAQGSVPVSFLDYDWTLNDSRSSSRR